MAYSFHLLFKWRFVFALLLLISVFCSTDAQKRNDPPVDKNNTPPPLGNSTQKTQGPILSKLTTTKPTPPPPFPATNTTTEKPVNGTKATTNESNSAISMPIVIGAGAAVIGIIALIVILMKCRSKKSGSKRGSDMEESSTPSESFGNDTSEEMPNSAKMGVEVPDTVWKPKKKKHKKSKQNRE